MQMWGLLKPLPGGGGCGTERLGDIRDLRVEGALLSISSSPAGLVFGRCPCSTTC